MPINITIDHTSDDDNSRTRSRHRRSKDIYSQRSSDNRTYSRHQPYTEEFDSVINSDASEDWDPTSDPRFRSHNIVPENRHAFLKSRKSRLVIPRARGKRHSSSSNHPIAIYQNDANNESDDNDNHTRHSHHSNNRLGRRNTLSQRRGSSYDLKTGPKGGRIKPHLACIDQTGSGNESDDYDNHASFSYNSVNGRRRNSIYSQSSTIEASGNKIFRGRNTTDDESDESDNLYPDYASKISRSRNQAHGSKTRSKSAASESYVSTMPVNLRASSRRGPNDHVRFDDGDENCERKPEPRRSRSMSLSKGPSLLADGALGNIHQVMPPPPGPQEHHLTPYPPYHFNSDSKYVPPHFPRAENSNIILYDTYSQYHSFPYEICKEWEGMKMIITDINNKNKDSRDIRDDSFHLYSADGEIIPASQWNYVVRPGFEVTMLPPSSIRKMFRAAAFINSPEKETDDVDHQIDAKKKAKSQQSDHPEENSASLVSSNKQPSIAHPKPQSLFQSSSLVIPPSRSPSISSIKENQSTLLLTNSSRCTTPSEHPEDAQQPQRPPQASRKIISPRLEKRPSETVSQSKAPPIKLANGYAVESSKSSIVLENGSKAFSFLETAASGEKEKNASSVGLDNAIQLPNNSSRSYLSQILEDSKKKITSTIFPSESDKRQNEISPVISRSEPQNLCARRNSHAYLGSGWTKLDRRVFARRAVKARCHIFEEIPGYIVVHEKLDDESLEELERMTELIRAGNTNFVELTEEERNLRGSSPPIGYSNTVYGSKERFSRLTKTAPSEDSRATRATSVEAQETTSRLRRRGTFPINTDEHPPRPPRSEPSRTRPSLTSREIRRDRHVIHGQSRRYHDEAPPPPPLPVPAPPPRIYSRTARRERHRPSTLPVVNAPTPSYMRPSRQARIPPNENITKKSVEAYREARGVRNDIETHEHEPYPSSFHTTRMTEAPTGWELSTYSPQAEGNYYQGYTPTRRFMDVGENTSIPNRNGTFFLSGDFLKQVKPSNFTVAMLVYVGTEGIYPSAQLFRLKFDAEVDDYELFKKLRSEYYKLRGLWRKFTFKGIVEVNIAQYNVSPLFSTKTWRSGDGGMPTMLHKVLDPPANSDDFIKRNYVFRTFCKTNLNDLRGEYTWVDWFSSLQGSQSTIPNETDNQRRNRHRNAYSQQEECISGEGLVIREGWQLHKVLWISVGFCLSSFIIAVFWSFKYTVEQGFAIGSYLLGMSSFLIAIVAFISSVGV